MRLVLVIIECPWMIKLVKKREKRDENKANGPNWFKEDRHLGSQKMKPRYQANELG